MIGDRTRTMIIAVVTVVWALNFLAGMPFMAGLVGEYQPSESINGIFMAIVGSLFALGARAEKKEEAAKEISAPKQDEEG